MRPASALNLNASANVVNYEIYHEPDAATQRLNHSQSDERLNDTRRTPGARLEFSLAAPSGLPFAPNASLRTTTGSLTILPGATRPNNAETTLDHSAHGLSLGDLNAPTTMLNGTRPRYDTLHVTVPRVPGYGLGIAIAGGTDNPNHSTGDPTVIVSDVIKGGPADPKLRPNDRIVSVNGISLDGVDHSFAARLLKECGAQATLVVRRVASSLPNGGALSVQPARSRLSYPPTVNPNVGAAKTNGTAASNSQLNPIANASMPNAPQNAPANANYNASVLSMLDSTSSAKGSLVPRTQGPDAVQARKPEPSSAEMVVLHCNGATPLNGLEIGCRFFIKRVDRSSEPFFGRLGIGDTLLRVGRVELDSPFMSADEVRRLLFEQARSDSLTLLVERGRATPVPANGMDPGPPRPPLPVEYQQATRLTSSNSVQLLPQARSAPVRNSAPMHRSAQLATRFSPNAATQQSTRQPAPQSAAARFASMPGTRRAILEKSPVGSFGLRLVGGNARGLFVASTQPGSSAANLRLLEGDRLLAIGQLDLVGPPKCTKEEALRALVGAPQRVEIVWTSDARAEYDMLVSSGEQGDDLFVRVHMHATYRRADVLVEMHYNDVYHVLSTVHGGQLGSWFGAKVDSAMRELARTEIPNEETAFQLAERSRAELAHAGLDTSASPSPNDSPERAASAHHHNTFVSSSNAFFRRLKRVATTGNIHQLVSGSSSESLDTAGSTAQLAVRLRNAVLLNTQFAAYERVEARSADFLRPVVIFGPLSEVARDHLTQSLSAKFESALSEFAPSSGEPLDSLPPARIAAIRDVLARNKHCVLDITPSAVDALNRAELYPIVIFIKATSRQQVKDARAQFSGRVGPQHGAKWLFEFACALERECAFMFTAVVHLSNDDVWLKKLIDVVNQQQTQRIWFVSNSSLARSAESNTARIGSQTLQRPMKANGTPRWNDDTAFGFSPANASVRLQNNGFSPANTSIRPQGNGFSPANASIRPQGNGFSPANSSIRPQGNGFSAANASIRPQSNGSPQIVQNAGGTLKLRPPSPRTGQLDFSRATPNTAPVSFGPRFATPNNRAPQAPTAVETTTATNTLRRNSDPATNPNQNSTVGLSREAQMNVSMYAYSNVHQPAKAPAPAMSGPGSLRPAAPHIAGNGELAAANDPAFTQQIRIGNASVTAPRQPLHNPPGRNYQPQVTANINVRGPTLSAYGTQPDGAAKSAMGNDAAMPYYTSTY